MTIFGVIAILNKKFLKELTKCIDDKKVFFLSGFISLVMGLINIVLHNVFEWNWRLIITLFGYMALFKGILILGFPKEIRKFYKKFDFDRLFSKIMMLIVGLSFLVFYLYLTQCPEAQ